MRTFWFFLGFFLIVGQAHAGEWANIATSSNTVEGHICDVSISPGGFTDVDCPETNPEIMADGTISASSVHVNSIKIGNSTQCATADEGAIRYTGGSLPWQYCNGSSWKNFQQPRCQDDDTGECYLDDMRSNDDPEFTANNIKSGTNILGITGTYSSCALPTDCPNPGNSCPDGSKFVGLRVYGTACDAVFVADFDQSSGTTWGPNSTTGATSWNDGKENQDHIQSTQNITNFPAFNTCYNLDRHGHQDWYLPAELELYLLASMHKEGVGSLSFSNSTYWSSTEATNLHAWFVEFSTGNTIGTSHGNNWRKYNKDFRVRCIRRQ